MVRQILNIIKWLNFTVGLLFVIAVLNRHRKLAKRSNNRLKGLAAGRILRVTQSAQQRAVETVGEVPGIYVVEHLAICEKPVQYSGKSPRQGFRHGGYGSLLTSLQVPGTLSRKHRSTRRANLDYFIMFI
jgi:hypothetical protein